MTYYYTCSYYYVITDKSLKIGQCGVSLAAMFQRMTEAERISNSVAATVTWPDAMRLLEYWEKNSDIAMIIDLDRGNVFRPKHCKGRDCAEWDELNQYTVIVSRLPERIAVQCQMAVNRILAEHGESAEVISGDPRECDDCY